MSAQPVTAPPQRRLENLAFCCQELLTVGERLRSNRQPVSDARTFRAQIWEAIKSADAESRRRGYTAEDIELAIFAVIAFLDESILNLHSPTFADWPRQPMQEERYGHHIAGEIFFQNLQKLLGRNDSQELADLLEIYDLCMLLGFSGKYTLGGRGELKHIQQATAEKIDRIRRPSPEISPNWALPVENYQFRSSDPWVSRILYGAIGCVVLTLVLFIVYTMALRGGIGTLRSVAGLS